MLNFFIIGFQCIISSKKKKIKVLIVHLFYLMETGQSNNFNKIIVFNFFNYLWKLLNIKQVTDTNNKTTKIIYNILIKYIVY